MKIIYKYQIQILNANIICSSHVQITYAKNYTQIFNTNT